jgi:hypothetical protein
MGCRLLSKQDNLTITERDPGWIIGLSLNGGSIDWILKGHRERSRMDLWIKPQWGICRLDPKRTQRGTVDSSGRVEACMLLAVGLSDTCLDSQ